MCCWARFDFDAAPFFGRKTVQPALLLIPSRSQHGEDAGVPTTPGLLRVWKQSSGVHLKLVPNQVKHTATTQPSFCSPSRACSIEMGSQGINRTYELCFISKHSPFFPLALNNYWWGYWVCCLRFSDVTLKQKSLEVRSSFSCGLCSWFRACKCSSKQLKQTVTYTQLLWYWSASTHCSQSSSRRGTELLESISASSLRYPRTTLATRIALVRSFQVENQKQVA